MNDIPRIGLGLWQVKDQAEFNEAFAAAIDAGYRHFDTAQIYGNEHMLGEALQDLYKTSDLTREDIWITTKIAVNNFGHKHALASFKESLAKLKTDYVDLLLLHFPVTLLRKESWKALEELHVAGTAKHIGVSNYTIRHLEEMKDYARIMPQFNQIELHVFLQQPELIKYCQDTGITVEAYSPLAHSRDMTDPVITQIAEKHGKSYAQIMLRWCLEQNLVVLPKSVTPERIQQNIDILDFSLDAEDMQKLAALDRDLRTCWSPVHVP